MLGKLQRYYDKSMSEMLGKLHSYSYKLWQGNELDAG
jgi:hypothetical protein